MFIIKGGFQKKEEEENMIFVLINILVATTTSPTCAIRRLLLYHQPLTRSAFFPPKEWKNYFNSNRKIGRTEEGKKKAQCMRKRMYGTAHHTGRKK
jgi:hypothetical protein